MGMDSDVVVAGVVSIVCKGSTVAVMMTGFAVGCEIMRIGVVVVVLGCMIMDFVIFGWKIIPVIVADVVTSGTVFTSQALLPPLVVLPVRAKSLSLVCITS
jgi:hypothetical protein